MPDGYAGYDAEDPANYDWTISDACLANVYDSTDLAASVRLGHSRAYVADFDYCYGPDDAFVFANVSAAVMRRYAVEKKYPLQDVSVWNEPSGYVEGEASPFWCAGPHAYASSYVAVRKRLAAEFPDIQLGIALGLDDFSRTVLDDVKGNGSSFDFVDIHMYTAAAPKSSFLSNPFAVVAASTEISTSWPPRPASNDDLRGITRRPRRYPDVPSALKYQIYGKPGRGNLEEMLEDHGFDPGTRVQLGEWSRSIGLDYATDCVVTKLHSAFKVQKRMCAASDGDIPTQRLVTAQATDGPGAAWLACGLGYLHGMGIDQSAGAHNVDQAYVYASPKLWDGSGGDLNAATIWTWWGRQMAGKGEVPVAGTRSPEFGDDDDLCAVAGRDAEALTVVVAQYEPVAGAPNTKPSTGACFDLAVALENVPWAEWTWTQYSNVAPAKLASVAWGSAAGDATLHLKMHGNAFSTLHISPASVPLGAAAPGWPVDAEYTSDDLDTVAANTCGGPTPAYDEPNSASTSRSAVAAVLLFLWQLW